MDHQDETHRTFDLLKRNIQRLVFHRSPRHNSLAEGQIGGLSYGQANNSFQTIMSAMKEATVSTDKLWNDVLDAIDRQTAIAGALMNNLRILAISILAVAELAESRSQDLRRTGKSSNEESQSIIEGDVEAFILIANRAYEALSSSHIGEIDVKLGERYDPSLHEPTSAYVSSYPTGSVCRVLEKGYVYRGECGTCFVVRPVQVDVSSGLEVKEEMSEK